MRTYTAEGVGEELEAATLSYMEGESSLDRERAVLRLPGVVKLYRSDFGPDEELVELAAWALGGGDADWIREHADELKIGFEKFNWQLEGDMARA